MWGDDPVDLPPRVVQIDQILIFGQSMNPQSDGFSFFNIRFFLKSRKTVNNAFKKTSHKITNRLMKINK